VLPPECRRENCHISPEDRVVAGLATMKRGLAMEAMEDGRVSVPGDKDAATAGEVRPGGVWSGPAVKFFVVAFLVGLLMVPLLFVWALSSERESRRSDVVSTIASDWGGSQLIRGPFLVVPWRKTGLEMRDGRPVPVDLSGAVIVHPDALTAELDAATSVRTVSIHDVPVYNTLVALKARFPAVDPDIVAEPGVTMDWSRAKVAIAIPSLHGIEEARITVGGTDFAIEPTTGMPKPSDYATMSSDGIHAVVGTASSADGLPPLDIDVTLRLRGSGSLAVFPSGRESTVTIAADWEHPSFVGWLLPSEWEKTAEGFRAVWRVPYLVRSEPQVLTADQFVRSSGYDRAAGVSLSDPVDTYSLMDRALKYGVMFVAAIFYIVFFLEVLSKRKIHVVQYCIVGMIAVFFYVLLLALAEHVSFGPAFLVASGATGGVIATFVGVALSSWARAAAAAVGFAALFGLLYAILRLEDVALLGGAMAGFVILTVALFASRRVDWSGRAEPPALTAPAPGSP
jgi:inner membrane protein